MPRREHQAVVSCLALSWSSIGASIVKFLNCYREMLQWLHQPQPDIPLQRRRQLKSYRLQVHRIPKLDGSETLVRVLFPRSVYFHIELAGAVTGKCYSDFICCNLVCLCWFCWKPGWVCDTTTEACDVRYHGLNMLSWSGDRVWSHRGSGCTSRVQVWDAWLPLTPPLPGKAWNLTSWPKPGVLRLAWTAVFTSLAVHSLQLLGVR